MHSDEDDEGDEGEDEDGEGEEGESEDEDAPLNAKELIARQKANKKLLAPMSRVSTTSVIHTLSEGQPCTLGKDKMH